MPIVHFLDDDPACRKAISRLLRTAGYKVAVHETAEQLLAQLSAEDEQGCVLLDVLMPGLSGPEVQQRLANVHSSLPIIFITGSAQVIESGADDFLTKPVPKQKLFDAIERALRMRAVANDQPGVCVDITASACPDQPCCVVEPA